MTVRYDFQEVVALAALWDRAPDLAQAELRRAMTEATQYLERETKERTPVGVGGGGGLRGSIHSTVELSSGGRAVLGVVGSPLNYAAPVELGTKPHHPPVEPIEDWVQAKLGLRGKAARRAAWGIAQKIAVRGTTGKYMFRDALADGEATVRRIFDAARDRIAARVTGGAA